MSDYMQAFASLEEDINKLEGRVKLLEGIIEKALDIADINAGFDGGHHKMWVIDQMVRQLNNCPLITKSFVDYLGVEYQAEVLEENKAYLTWVIDYEKGEDGPKTYEWDVGIEP